MTTPILDAINKYIKSKPTPFHMPGHKLGSFFAMHAELINDRIDSSNAKEILKLLNYDLTEIPGLDNLNSPNGIIKEAMAHTKRAFKSDDSYLLVNGSTVGIHALIMATCFPNDKILIQRNSHKAVNEGIILANAIPVYISPEFDQEFGIPLPVTPKMVEKSLTENPEIRVVFLTRPDYFGQCCDIKAISKIVHDRGKILIIDEAHGAHLTFCEKLPISSIEAEVDACVQSAHKTLPALTQGAWVHLKGNLIDADKVEEMLTLLQTTSPSYLIMMFLDIARDVMEKDGERLLEDLLKEILNIRLKLTKIGYKVLEKTEEYDFTRLTVNVSSLNITGYEAEKYLWEKHAIQVEMSDLNNLILIFTVADSRDTLNNLIFALEDLYLSCMSKIANKDGALLENPIRKSYLKEFNFPKRIYTPNEAFYSNKMRVSMDDSINKVSADFIVPYPPGIPLLCPGELITAESISYINEIIALGGTVNGLSDGKLKICIDK